MKSVGYYAVTWIKYNFHFSLYVPSANNRRKEVNTIDEDIYFNMDCLILVFKKNVPSNVHKHCCVFTAQTNTFISKLDIVTVQLL